MCENPHWFESFKSQKVFKKESQKLLQTYIKVYLVLVFIFGIDLLFKVITTIGKKCLVIRCTYFIKTETYNCFP